MRRSSPRSQLVLVLAVIVSAVGLVDAVVGGTWDFVVVFGLSLVLQSLLVLRSSAGRVELTLRRDLAAWLSSRAVATGEEPEEVLDRCVAMVRAGLLDEDVT